MFAGTQHSDSLQEALKVFFVRGDSYLKVKLEAYSELRKTVGACPISFDMKDADSIGDFVFRLTELCGAKFREETGKDLARALEEEYTVLVNGRSIRFPHDGKLKLDEDSTIVIMRPVRGG